MADTPNSPPDNPFEAQGGGYPPTIDPSASDLPLGRPNVAARPGKAFAVIGLVGVAVAFLLYNIMSTGGDKPQPVKNEGPKIETGTNIPPPDIIEPPKPPVKAPDFVVPAIPDPVAVPAINPEDDSAAKAQELARLRSGMMLKEGGSILESDAKANDSGNDFTADINKKVERVKATKIGDLRRTIAQGRMIQATMESALNTDLPAPIRAIVSRDVYAEAGNVPLIPKGSRLIGEYNAKLDNGQTRVFVVWSRVIRPDGIDVMIGSPLVDALGSAGVAGQIDTKFQQMFARSLLSSVMNIATAIGAERLQGGTTTTTSSTTGTQTSGDAATTATTNALNRLGSVTDGFLQRFIAIPPTILVDQGTPVNVFVNKDLIFPSDASGTQIIN